MTEEAVLRSATAVFPTAEVNRSGASLLGIGTGILWQSSQGLSKPPS